MARKPAVTGGVPVDSGGNPTATTTGHLGITVLEKRGFSVALAATV